MNYVQVKDALTYRDSFKHESCSGYRDSDGETVCNRKYHVYSYQTRILTYNLDTHEVEYFDNRKHSITTSKQQAMIKVAFPQIVSTRFEHRVVYDGSAMMVACVRPLELERDRHARQA